MMKTIFFILLQLIIFPVLGETIKCPQGSMLVELTLSFSQEKMEVCQKKIGDKFVKDGPEIIYNKNGSLKSKKYYKLDVESEEVSLAENSPSINDSKQIETRLRRLFDQMFDSLFANYETNVLDISEHGYCPENAQARLQFVLNGTPYVNNVKFSTKCDYEGKSERELNKKLSVTFKVKGNYDYKKLSFDYFITKETSSEKIKIATKITNGIFTMIDDKKTVKFTANFVVQIFPKEVLMSGGKTGLSIEEGIIDVNEYDGRAFQYHEDYIESHHLKNK